MKKGFVPRLVWDGKKVPQGVMIVPTSRSAFKKAGMEPITTIFLPKGGVILTKEQRENLERKFAGLKIYRNKKDPESLVMILPVALGDKVSRTLEHMGWPVMRTKASLSDLRLINKTEIVD